MLERTVRSRGDCLRATGPPTGETFVEPCRGRRYRLAPHALRDDLFFLAGTRH
ncbi:MAG: hypothetical protein BroJett026_27200 [Betaproteobacteria bacterium]|nr:MAG: hypothetical protein BroJett026_27200 [Betaproteobacteria bacterium]